MDMDPSAERSLVGRTDKSKPTMRLWIIPASILAHLVVCALLFVQWPDLQLNAAPEQTVSLELVAPEELPVPEAEEAPEEPPSEEEAPEEPAPEEQPEAPSAEASQPEPNILPNIAIRPEETRLDAVDTGEAAEAPEDVNEEEQEIAQQPPRANESEYGEFGFGEATSEVGDLPAGDIAPIPAAKPDLAKVEPELEEKEPLANAAIEEMGLRQIMGDLPPRRRLIQICTMEAIAQIQRHSAKYAAVRGVVPGSDEGLKINGGSLIGRGGAFNVAGQWTEIEFDCEADLETFKVLAFRQKIGRRLSQDEVKARGFDRFN